MASATTHIESVGGYSGDARCYRLDPPFVSGGRTVEFATVCIQPRFAHQAAEVKVYPALESGASTAHQLRRCGGSFTLHDDYTPGDTAYEDGVRALALTLLGGYEVEQ